MTNNRLKMLGGALSASWGVIGFAWILLDAIKRLSVLAAHGLATELAYVHWLGLLIFLPAMAYMEGYRGFQKSFSPRVAARALYLYRHPGIWSGLLAPVFCMGFFFANRRALLFAWVGTTLIVCLVVALRFVPQPWRAIVDAGVVVGLSWGLISFLCSTWAAFRGDDYPGSPALPEHESPAATGL